MSRNQSHMIAALQLFSLQDASSNEQIDENICVDCWYRWKISKTLVRHSVEKPGGPINKYQNL